MKSSTHVAASGSEAREHCFVIMSYKPAYLPVFNQIKECVEKHTGLQCIRADQRPEPGRNLLDKVHEQILGASVVIADVSEHSPNVYYEYGYASAHHHPGPILIARKGLDLPKDLVGKDALEYHSQSKFDDQFVKQFLACVDQQLRSPLPEQRRMLASEKPFPAYVIAAPRAPGVGSKHWWHPEEQETYGDMLGIAGILTAYGNLFGTRQLPELLNAQCVSPRVLAKPANFFCVGSPKVNPATERLLMEIQQGLKPQWKMPQIGPGKDKRVILQGDARLDAKLAAPVEKKGNFCVSDYGLIVRAPHPLHEQRLVLIVAGRHSIGTHAASMMVTRQDLIAKLETRLKRVGVLLQNTHQPFWAIVRGTVLRSQRAQDNVRIVKVGGYASRATQ